MKQLIRISPGAKPRTSRSGGVSSERAEAAAAQRGGAGDRAQLCGARRVEAWGA